LAAGEFLLGIDFRPVNQLLYAIASRGVAGQAGGDRLVTVDRTTGAVASVNAANTLTTPAGTFFGVDFNPVPDAVREVSDADISLRIDPNTGMLAGTDTNLAYAPGDVNFGANPSVVHVAYTNNVAGATTTTLFGIDFANDALVRIGGVGGTPSPNGGQLTTIGGLGVTTNSAFGGFDVRQGTGVAYAALRVGGMSRLYTINLNTGLATAIGPIGNGTNSVDGLSVAIFPSTAAGVEVSGRVTTPDGRGLRNARVSITDQEGVVRWAITGSFGYYRFDDIEAGETYIIGVASKRYTFTPRVLQVFDNLSNVDFTAQE